MTIAASIAAIQDVILAQTGVRGGPDNPPDKIAAAQPFSVAMAGPGTVNYSDGLTIWYPQTIRVWLTVAHNDTARNDATVIGYGDTVPEALWAEAATDPTLGGAMDSIEAIRIVGYGPWQINGMPRYGWYFEIDVRITSC